jgi:hypothetical protein
MSELPHSARCSGVNSRETVVESVITWPCTNFIT